MLAVEVNEMSLPLDELDSQLWLDWAAPGPECGLCLRKYSSKMSGADFSVQWCQRIINISFEGCEYNTLSINKETICHVKIYRPLK